MPSHGYAAQIPLNSEDRGLLREVAHEVCRQVCTVSTEHVRDSDLEQPIESIEDQTLAMRSTTWVRGRSNLSSLLLHVHIAELVPLHSTGLQATAAEEDDHAP